MSRRLQQILVAVGLFVLFVYLIGADDSLRRFLSDIYHTLAPYEAQTW